MFNTQKTFSCAIVLAFFATIGFSAPISASGAVVVMKQQEEKELEQKHYQAQSPVNAYNMANDGFVVVREFFNNGQEFRLCAPSNTRGEAIKAAASGCVLQKGVFTPDREKIEDYSPQEFLDAAFGKGVTALSSVSFYKPHRDHMNLVIYYRIVNN